MAHNDVRDAREACDMSQEELIKKSGYVLTLDELREVESDNLRIPGMKSYLLGVMSGSTMPIQLVA